MAPIFGRACCEGEVWAVSQHSAAVQSLAAACDHQTTIQQDDLKPEALATDPWTAQMFESRSVMTRRARPLACGQGPPYGRQSGHPGYDSDAASYLIVFDGHRALGQQLARVLDQRLGQSSPQLAAAQVRALHGDGSRWAAYRRVKCP